MAQMINIATVDENRSIKERYSVNFAPTLKFVWKKGEDKYPWLTAIDEYGNTYINPRQAKYVIAELQLLDAPAELELDIKEVIALLRGLETHTHLAFFGD